MATSRHDGSIAGDGTGRFLRKAGRRVLVALSTLVALSVSAAQVDIQGPPGSVEFGRYVTALPSGNFVVVDSRAEPGEAGAVYLYAADGSLLSTLRGSSPGDRIGDHGITVLPGGDFLVHSPRWNNAGVQQAGALTWVDGKQGLDGAVSPANSLVGTQAGDYVGLRVTVLDNGNYVAVSPYWSGAGVAEGGAVTWCRGDGAAVGPVTTANSLVGTEAGEHLGDEVVALRNGNYVVVHPLWNDDGWLEVGAVTWGDGTRGVTGVISADNSLVGTAPFDTVGSNGVVALANGNYVVASPGWADYRGAATFGNGATGTTGPVTAQNSLVGSDENDEVGLRVVALRNGNYVVASPGWGNDQAPNAGAATWGDGTTGVVGAVSSANSLVGTHEMDQVGLWVTALDNGHYVAASPFWNGAQPEVGAVTWGDGSHGSTGEVGPANSLVGSRDYDQVGEGGAVALRNGHYAVVSSQWNNGSVARAGAVTWADGNGVTAAAVSAANSLVGSVEDDEVGAGGVTALSDGNYAVASPLWSHGAVPGVGAATWGNGNGATVGPVTPGNSLIGSSAYDAVSGGHITALAHGHYSVGSDSWDDGSITDAGAMTWARAGGGTIGVVSRFNSLIGVSADNFVGGEDARPCADGNYLVWSPQLTHGANVDSGAVTLLDSRFRVSGPPEPWNSVLGGIASGGIDMQFDCDTVGHRMIVGRPAENIVSVFTMDAIFADGLEP